MASRCHRIFHHKISMNTFIKMCTGGKHLQIQLPTMVRTGLIKSTITSMTPIKTRTCFKIRWGSKGLDKLLNMLGNFIRTSKSSIRDSIKSKLGFPNSRWKLKMDREELMRSLALSNRIYHRIFQKRRANNQIRCTKCGRRRLTSCLHSDNSLASIEIMPVLNLKYLIPI